MSKRRTSGVFTDDLKKEVEAHRARSLSEFRKPKYPPALVITRLDVPRGHLGNWFARPDLFKLDADAGHEVGKRRLLSARDCLLLGGTSHLISHGVPLTVAIAAAQFVVDRIIQLLGTVMMGVPKETLIISRDQRDQRDWQILPFRSVPRPHGETNRIASHIFRDGEWMKVAPEDDVSIPPVHIAFDVEAFAKRALGEIGIIFVAGTDEDFRRAADEMEKKA